MKKLYLSAASQRMINGRTEYCRNSRFINEIPDEYLEIEGSFTPGGSGSGNYGGTYGYGANGKYGKAASASGGDINADGIREMLNLAVKKSKPAVSNGYPGFGKPFPMNDSSQGKSMNEANYQVGDKVRHMKFGPGEVVEVIPAGSDQEITVDFERVGKKKMFASLVKMKKI
jgi:DNA helicase-2/ATP-dependent DNA helicase PcrA